MEILIIVALLAFVAGAISGDSHHPPHQGMTLDVIRDIRPCASLSTEPATAPPPAYDD